MPLFAIGVIALQVACIVHMVKTGRNLFWLSALIFMPVVGAIAYFIVEIMPGMQHERHVRTARAKAVAALDPKRQVRAARDAIDLADTAANQLKLADALSALGQHEEAIPVYREAIRKTAGDPDVRTQGKLANALYETGAAEEALELLDEVDLPQGQSERDKQQLLRGKILEHLGRKDEALGLYADVVTRIPGEEARCRYAALLIEMGRSDDALIVLEEVESRMKRLDRLQRAADADMYRWAGETLAKLRRGA